MPTHATNWSKLKTKAKNTKSGASESLNKSGLLDEEDFFDFISRYVKGISTIHVILERVIHFSMSGSSRSEWTTKGALWQIQNPPLIPPIEVTIV